MPTYNISFYLPFYCVQFYIWCNNDIRIIIKIDNFASLFNYKKFTGHLLFILCQTVSFANIFKRK